MSKVNKNQKPKSKKEKNLTPANNRKIVGAILFAITLGVFLLFALRFSYVIATGKVAGESLSDKTEALYQGTSTVKAKRGTIYDRNGEVIAADATSYSLFAVLDKDYKWGEQNLYVEDKDIDDIAEVLSEYTELTKDNVKSVLAQRNNPKVKQVEFGADGKDLNVDTKRKIEAAFDKKKIKGIYFAEHPARIYPNGSFASYLIGYAQLADAENESKGLDGVMGIESAYDDVLSGKDGKVHYQKDSSGNAIPGTSVVIKEAVDGSDIYTSLDKTLQLYAEDLLKSAQEQYQPQYYTAMLVEAKTGKILVAAQTPSFDPETPAQIEENKPVEWRDLLVEESFEPGSTIKAFTVAAAIETGNFNANATYQAGQTEIDGTVIRDWTTDLGVLTFEQALIASSNAGMIKLEQMMDANNHKVWTDYLRKFGFTKSTDSKLANEAEGIIQETYPIDRAMTAYGQALSVTDFQMVQAYSAIANGGEMLKPQYINKIVNTTEGTEKIYDKKVVGNPIKASTATEVLQIMNKVTTDPRGTGLGYAVEGINISAKTGTAQIASKTGGYMEGTYDYIYSVAEIAPTEDPKYILYVTVKQPNQYNNDDTIARITNNLLKRAIELDNETATDVVTKESIKVDNFVGKTATEAANSEQSAKLEMVVIGNGQNIIGQSTKAQDTILAGQKLLLLTDGTITLPDLTGWSKNDVLKLSDLIGLDVAFSGKGYVKKQNIDAGTEVTKGEKLTISLGGGE